MATTNVHPVADMRSRVEYIVRGRGEKRRQNMREGTDRVAVVRCDIDAETFCSYSAAMRESYGRKYDGYELRVSFGRDELDPSNTDDLKRCADIAYEAAGRLWPGRYRYVVVHVDGEGGCVHAHCEVCSHDPLTGRAINSNTSHKSVSACVDDVCRQRGAHVIGDHAGSWAEAKKERTLSEFELKLGDRIDRCLRASASTEEFKARLEAAGVELRETRRTVKKKDGSEETAVGWSYSMVDATGTRRRRRRRKASNLCDEFTRESVMERYGEIPPRPRKQRAKRRERHEQPDPRLHDDGKNSAFFGVNGWRVRANMAAMADEGMLAKPNLYRELRERLDSGGREKFEADFRRMREDMERAREELSRDREARRLLAQRPENVAFRAAEKELDKVASGDEEASMVAALSLIMLAMGVQATRSALKGAADGRVSRSRMLANEAEFRARAAQTVLEQYDDDARVIRASSAAGQAGAVDIGSGAHARRQAQRQMQRSRSIGGPRMSRGLSL